MFPCYTGIGSRETPSNIKELMRQIAIKLSSSFFLRSGGAPGADTAFEEGSSRFIIYLPWDGFNNRYKKNNTNNIRYISFDDQLPIRRAKALQVAEQFHPNWKACKPVAQKFLARDVWQVLDLNLDSPSSFIVCWTKDGKDTGGTGQAIRIGMHYNIPIFNLYNQNAYNDLISFLEKNHVKI